MKMKPLLIAHRTLFFAACAGITLSPWAGSIVLYSSVLVLASSNFIELIWLQQTRTSPNSKRLRLAGNVLTIIGSALVIIGSLGGLLIRLLHHI